jgi:hypothetical protein
VNLVFDHLSRLAKVSLVHPQETFHVSADLLVQKSDLFRDNPVLADSPYTPKSGVSLAEFREFVSALEGSTLTITKDNISVLSQLCDEFRFQDLSAHLTRFRQSHGLREAATMKNTKTRISLSMTETNHCSALFDATFTFSSHNDSVECSIDQAVVLSPAVREQLSTDACARTFAFRDVGAVDSIRRLLSGDRVSVVQSQTTLGLDLTGSYHFDLNSVDLSKFSVEALDEFLAGASFSVVDEDDLLHQLLGLGDEYRPLLRRIEMRFLSAAGFATLAEYSGFPPECVWCGVVDRLTHSPELPGPFQSAIIADIPEIFAEFRGKRFSLLWRGSLHGFGARDFHSRCDGHTNTLTLILNARGHIFGGFTPVAWDSDSCWKADPDAKSAFFTLRNPQNGPARRFALNPEKKDEAIFSDIETGPWFHEIGIYDNCNTTTANFAFFGTSDNYINDTTLDGYTLFTDRSQFSVKEIEIFEITD